MLVFVVFCMNFEVSLSDTVKVGVMLDRSLEPFIETYLKDGSSMAAASNIMVNVTYEISYVRDALVCDGITGIRGALDLITNNSLDVIFGSYCHENCLGSAQVADYFDLPYLPLTCQDPALDDSSIYKTKIRIFGSLSSFGPAFLAFYANSSWFSTAVVTESSSYLCKTTVDSIMLIFRQGSVKISDFIQLSSSIKEEELQSLIKIKASARIIIVCHTNYSSLQEIIFTAQEMGMTDPSSYAWITFYNIYGEFPYKMIFTPWITDGKVSQEQLEKQKEAFYCLKIVSFKNFTSMSSLRGFFNSSAPIRLSYLTEISYLYLVLRNKVINSGNVPKGGRNLLNASRLVEIDGRYERLTFNNHGDRMMSFIVWSLAPNASTFEPMFQLEPVSLYNYTPILVGEYTWGSSFEAPSDIPSCGFLNELCATGKGKTSVTTPLIASFVVAVILIIFGFTTGIIQNRRRVLKSGWKINQEELEFLQHPSKKIKMELDTPPNNIKDKNESPVNNDKLRSTNSEMTAVFRGAMVTINCFFKRGIKLSRQDLKELAELKDLQHDNLVSFLGAYMENDGVYLVIRHSARGSLQQNDNSGNSELSHFHVNEGFPSYEKIYELNFWKKDILTDSDVKLEASFQMSFIRDIIKGMAYLHKSFLNYHGRLSSSVCMVTNRWVVKITGFGVLEFRRSNQEELSEDEFYKRQLWTAPEHLRSKIGGEGSQKGDVFSFAIVAHEIIFKTFPYQTYSLTNKEIISKIRDSGYVIFRPSVVSMDKTGIDGSVLDLVRKCWDENPVYRPSFDEINKKFRKDNKDIIDSMLDKLEKYANNLEAVVQERTDKLIEEKRKTDMLLHSLLPPYVAEELKAGRQVEPRFYQMVTVYFSDIVGFTTLSSQSTPMEVVNLLNDLYGTFDDTIARHNVYKVETIGDAYMVVSGLPQETTRHMVEICNMALDLLSIVQTFKIRHRPEMTLMLRIGIHCGPCAAGVVGHTMPRYCLFGDTVNIASRMESTGKALKIHISSPAKDQLMQFPGYVIELRGDTELKGMGVMTTYWLIRKENGTS